MKFDFDLEQVWYIMQACVREQANVETNIRIMPDRLDNMDFINRCKHDSEQYAKMRAIMGACDVVGFSNNCGDTLFILVKEMEG